VWIHTAALGGDANAVAWLERAAAEGVPAAVGRLANLYANGKGVTADGAKAVQLYETAADKGDTFAQMQLGLRYAKGEGVTLDYVQAHKWVNLAAAGGDGEAGEVARRVRQADDGGTGRRGASAGARMDAEKPCAAEVG
jgi:TPR repeat protein